MAHPTPHPLGDEKRHYWLAVEMAQKTGADMQAALETGVLSAQDWAGLVQRCRGCNWAEGCDCWMKDQAVGDADVPAACPNAEIFARVIEAQDTT